MTYDRSSGTQVFVGGRGETEVSAFNRDTGASAALRGDLSRPGVAESWACLSWVKPAINCVLSRANAFC